MRSRKNRGGLRRSVHSPERLEIELRADRWMRARQRDRRIVAGAFLAGYLGLMAAGVLYALGAL